MTDAPSVARRVLHSIGPLHRALSRHRGALIHSADFRRGRVRLGSHYGGWTVAPDLIDSESVVYSVGIGDDISFDEALIERFGCTVHAFDPTPVSNAWMARQTLPARFVHHAVGLGTVDGEAPFAPPTQEGWDNFNLPKPGTTENLTHLPVSRLETIAADLGHSRVDLLKMDIEGFEYGVIDDVLAGTLRPTQWLIEFHHGLMSIPPEQTRRAVSQLAAADYRLFAVSNTGREYSLVHGAGH